MTRTLLVSFTFLLLALTTPLKAAEFSLKQLIPLLQEKFGRTSPWPIVIMDKEELAWRFAQQKALGDGEVNHDKRIKIIQQYVFEKTKVQISQTEADQYDPYLTVLKDGAFALPILKSTYPAIYKVCAVFPATSYSNERLEHTRILALDTRAAYQGHSYDDLKVRLPYEVLARFSLYHELSHCRDQWFMPATFDYEDSHAVHLSESFAETAALLMLQNEGFSQIALPRAQLRALYSLKIGRYFAQNPQGGFGNPYYTDAGAIYYLSPVLKAAAEIKVSTEEVLTTAQTIVTKNALPQRGFTAVVRWLEAPLTAWDQYERLATESPDLFSEAFQTLVHYSKEASEMASEALSEDFNQPVTAPYQLEWDLSLCNPFVKGDHQGFLEALKPFLEDLSMGHGSPHEQSRRGQELGNLYQELQKSCTAP